VFIDLGRVPGYALAWLVEWTDEANKEDKAKLEQSK
jgi:hypothetical protein